MSSTLMSSALAALTWELGVIVLGVGVVVAALVATFQALVNGPRNSVVARIDAGVMRPAAAAAHTGPTESRWRRLLSRLASPISALARPSRAEELSELR